MTELKDIIKNLEEKYGASELRKEFRAYLLKRTYASGDVVKRKRLTPKQKQKLYTDQSGLCKRCDNWMSFRDATDDHIIAITQGGTNDISNRRLVCRSCNSSKGNNDLIQESKLTGKTILGQL